VACLFGVVVSLLPFGDSEFVFYILSCLWISLGVWVVSVAGGLCLVFLDLWLYDAFISIDIDAVWVFLYTSRYVVTFYAVFVCLGRWQSHSGDVCLR
jgi:hypothetical protein